jgi:hypothetical protein
MILIILSIIYQHPTYALWPLLIPLIGAGASLGSSLLGNASNNNQANTAYTRSVEMWNKQNEYNAPQAQMERLKAANLNPNLIYGNGSASTGNAVQIPRYEAPTQKMDIEFPKILETLQTFADLKIKSKQAVSLDQDIISKEINNRYANAIANNRVQSGNIGIENAYTTGQILNKENALKDIAWRVENSLYNAGYQVKRKNQEVANMVAERTLKAIQTTSLGQDLKFKRATYTDSLQRYSADTSNAISRNAFDQIMRRNSTMDGKTEGIPAELWNMAKTAIYSF